MRIMPFIICAQYLTATLKAKCTDKWRLLFFFQQLACQHPTSGFCLRLVPWVFPQPNHDSCQMFAKFIPKSQKRKGGREERGMGWWGEQEPHAKWNDQENPSSGVQRAGAKECWQMMLHGRNGDARMMPDGQVLRSHVCSPTHKNQDLDPNL